MLLNYLNIALRNLLKNKIHTTINVFGLAFGMASGFLITIYIRQELSYDRFHHHAEDLYRIVWMSENPQTRTPHPMAQALVADFPEVESAVSLTPLFAAGLTPETHSLRNPEKAERYDEKSLLAVDTTFFDVFNFPILKGDAKKALKQINGVLISESMARKYFGDDDPIGKHLAVDSTQYLVEVLAVFKDVPGNSHFHFDFLASYVREKSFNPGDKFYSWADFGHYNYIRLKHGADPRELEAKLMNWFRKYVEVPDDVANAFLVQHVGFKLQPVTDIHLRSRLRWELEPNGNMEYVYILAAAALFTLIIACVNFMNLTTAKSAERAKEIGVRKTMGAFRSQLSTQFLAESVTIALIAVLFSIAIIESALPFFNNLTGLSFVVNYNQYLMLVVAGVVIGLISGIYPSLYLSGVKPHMILKGKLIQNPAGSSLRRGLMIMQFSISMVLISSAAIIYNQLDFLQSKNLGFAREEVIIIPIKNEEGMSRFDAFRNEMLRVDGVSAVSASSNIPGGQFNQHSITLAQNLKHKVEASEAFVDYDFFKSLNVEIAEGRLFLRESPSDKEAFIINETAAKELNAGGSVLGKELVWNQDERTFRGTVIGIVKDFHFQSLHEPVRPLLFALSGRNFNYILIKLNTSEFSARIADVERVYKTFETTFGFEFTFMEDHLNRQYAAEKRTAGILAVFSIIALLIACFGLFGMSMLMFYQKIKEVSVRKVLGASPVSLLALLLGDFTKLVLMAVVIGTPVAWYFMTEWLKNFSYKVEIHPLVFVLSASVLVVISWATLSYFTLKASRLNPAETLKSE